MKVMQIVGDVESEEGHKGCIVNPKRGKNEQVNQMSKKSEQTKTRQNSKKGDENG